jgi:hypothetical protein
VQYHLVLLYVFVDEHVPLQALTDDLASSRGRGTRAAGWFADHIADQEDNEMKSLVLAEGIQGWATAGAEYVEWMEEYDANVWSKN